MPKRSARKIAVPKIALIMHLTHPRERRTFSHQASLLALASSLRQSSQDLPSDWLSRLSYYSCGTAWDLHPTSFLSTVKTAHLMRDIRLCVNVITVGLVRQAILSRWGFLSRAVISFVAVALLVSLNPYIGPLTPSNGSTVLPFMFIIRGS